MAKFGNIVIQALVLAAIFYAVAIHNIFWYVSPSVLFVLLAAALCLWGALRLWSVASPKTPDRFLGDDLQRTVPAIHLQTSWLGVLLALFFLVVVLQALPLPLAVVQTLSPERHAIAERAAQTMPALQQDRVTLSLDPIASRNAMTYYAMALMVFMMGNYLASSRRQARRLMTLLIWGALIQALYGLLEQLSGRHYIFWIPAGVTNAVGTFVNRNHFGAMLSLFLPATIGWFYYRAFQACSEEQEDDVTVISPWHVFMSRHGLWILAPALLALGIIQSHSRGAFSSMLLGLSLMALAGIRSKTGRAFGALGVALSLVIFSYGLQSDYDVVLQRFDDLIERGERGRTETWRDGMEIFQDYPLFGIGAGNFRLAYQRYSQNSSVSMPYRAHNEWLEGLVLHGLIGMIPVVALHIMFMVKTFKIIPCAGPDKSWYLGLWCGMLGFSMHAFMEFLFHSPGLSLLYFFVAGLMMGYERLVVRPPRPAPPLQALPIL